ncbi:MAG: deoxyribose-phosphate aldolase [Oscillospiraceae bacterium]|nr:deoxyribose-phosphate aldolase [Oscillospiraceae bacterium]
MENKDIFPHIDHTVLRPTSTQAEIDKLCEEALKYNTASVCIPPCYVSYVRNTYKELNICTVIGFPLGYSTSAVKCFEAQQAIKDGADEVDMVINICDVKNGRFDDIESEITAVKRSCSDKVLKVIIETCYLTEDEKIKLCGAVTRAGADYIKTSTGFGTDGAKIEDIRLFKQHIAENVKMKAAGGVKTKADLEMFLNEGCERIGTSSAVKLLLDGESNGGY